MAIDRAPVRPDDDRVADDAASLFGAYVHVPFCHRICPYCDFAVVAGGDDLRQRYVAALEAEIRRWPVDRPIDALFIGGGTPSRLDPDEVARIVAAVDGGPGLASGAEVTMEANPEDWTPQHAAACAAGGVNRVSLGIQSLDAAVLESLGRVHDRTAAGSAVSAARDAGLSVNVDLIFGTPGESVVSWERSVAGALDSGIDHLSIYALTVERGTPLSRSIASGAPAPDADDQADKWESAVAAATDAGLIRYETSNLAAPGEACVYNLITWAQGEYLAAGNGAHRHLRGERSWNIRRVDRYMEAIERGNPAVSGREALDPWPRELERLVIGLRRAAGASPGEAGAVLLASAAGERLVSAGVIESSAGRLRVIRPLLGDEVARTILGLETPEAWPID
ncbi:radical SAM family heme chaperone HemW [bacterium]|nr:radical SAM family heme chaperone HemW [bacterium]